MADHDPRDVETVARLLVSIDDGGGIFQWEAYRDDAVNLLDALQAKEWKITERPRVTHAAQDWHDAAPICPREDR